MQIFLTLTALAAITLVLGGRSSLGQPSQGEPSTVRASGTTRPDPLPAGPRKGCR